VPTSRQTGKAFPARYQAREAVRQHPARFEPTWIRRFDTELRAASC
jgi:hypothetical protein